MLACVQVPVPVPVPVQNRLLHTRHTHSLSPCALSLSQFFALSTSPVRSIARCNTCAAVRLQRGVFFFCSCFCCFCSFVICLTFRSRFLSRDVDVDGDGDGDCCLRRSHN